MDTILYLFKRKMKMKSLYIATIVTLETDPDSGVIQGYNGVETAAFTTERDGLTWLREKREATRDSNTCIRTNLDHQGIDEDDLEEFEKEYEVECEVKLTYYKTFTVTAQNEAEAEDLARGESDDHDYSYESPDDSECVIEAVTEA